MSLTFSLTSEQNIKLGAWITLQNANAIEAQKANPPDVPRYVLESSWDMGYPYGGAIGGNLTYAFTPTSLGVVVKVTDSLTSKTIDLSDYEDW